MTSINFIQKKSFKEKAFKTISVFVGVVTILNVSMVGALLAPTAASAATTDSGAIWTTTGTCGAPQDANHYKVGDNVYINASGFTNNHTYSWTIVGQPGGASSKPNVTVASGSKQTDNSGNVCFKAYTVKSDDNGEFHVTYGNKSDNYRVDGVAKLCGLTLTKSVSNITHPNGPNQPGDTLEYQIDYVNNGNAVCHGGGVRIDDTVPTGLTYNGVHTESVDGNENLLENDKPESGNLLPIQFGYPFGDLVGIGFPVANPIENLTLGASLLSWDTNNISPKEYGHVTFQVTINDVPSCTTKTYENTAKGYADELMRLTPRQVVSSNTTSTTVTTACIGSLKVTKVVSGGTAKAEQFGIRLNNTGTYTSPAAGKDFVTFDGLTAGQKYSADETLNGLPYTQTGNTCVDKKIVAGQTVTCTITNAYTPKGTITVYKYQNDGATPLAGATFKVCPHNSTTGCIAITDGVAPDATADGVVVFNNLDSSKSYDVTETVAPTGWNRSTDTHKVTLSYDHPTSSTSFNDTPVGKCVFDYSKKVDPSGDHTAKPGDTLTYTLHYENKGNANCTGGGVIMKDTIPANTTYIDGSHPAGVDYSKTGSTLTWNAHTVVPGESGDLTFKVKVNDGAYCKTIMNKGEAFADQFPDGMWTNEVTTNTACNGTLTVIKNVINDNGGLKTADMFKLHASNGTPGDFNGSATGTSVSIPVGKTYNVTEDVDAGYATSYSADCTGTMSTSGTKTCTVTNNDKPGMLIVKKHIINNNGGVKKADAFTMLVTGRNVSNSSFSGNEDGTTVTLSTGDFTVSEGDHTGYAMSVGEDCSGKIANGEEKTCTITNEDIAPSLTLVKHVSENSPLPASAWQLSATGTETPLYGTSGVTSGSNFLAGTYTLGESSIPGYTASAWTCDGASVEGNQIMLGVGQSATCAITNTFTPLTIVKTVNKATATPGDVLTYTITVTNPSDQNINDAKVTDVVPSYLTPMLPIVDATNYDVTTRTITWQGFNVNAHGTKVFTYQATVDSLMPFGTTKITNTAVLGCSDIREDARVSLSTVAPIDGPQCLWHGSSSVDTNVTAGSTIVVTKTGAATVVPGNNLVYTITWSIAGNAPVTGAKITDALPTNTTFVLADCGTTTGTCTPANASNTETWTLGNRNPGEHGTVTMTVKVAAPLANATVITNTAVFTTNEVGPVQSVANTTVQSGPILSITKSNDLTTFTTPGKVVNYTVVVTNASTATDTAKNVVMTDTLPTGFTFAADGTTTKSFTIGNLTPGQSVTTTFLVNISGTQIAGSYVNTAKAKGDNTTEVTATSSVEVRVPQVLGAATPELTITKTVNKSTAKPKDILTYTITVKNIGVGDASNVVVTDTLPKNLSFAHATGRTMTWNLGTLAAGHTRVLNVDVRVESDATRGTYTNVATVSADDIPTLQATAKITVTVPTVLGLATTGTGMIDYLIALLGASLILLGIAGITAKNKRDQIA